MPQTRFSFTTNPWCVTRDGDPDCRDLFHRHYSHRKYKDGRQPKLFAGPGYKLVLITPEADAVFVWRKFIDACIPEQTGVNCAIFRNEGPGKSSALILAAEELAAERWPDELRYYTYVNAAKVESPNPGYCFKCAEWRIAGHSKNGKLILENLHAAVPNRGKPRLGE